MEYSKPISTPMVIAHKLTKNDDSAEVNQTLYRCMIGKLQYVVHSRLDIALSIGIVARFSANPRENHLMDVKRTMRYLKRTHEFGLYYKKYDKFTSQSTTKAEYVDAIVNCTNIVWIKQLLKGMKEEIIELVTLYCDNTSVINI